MKIIIKTLHGAEKLLSKELETLGATDISAQRRAVTCEADKETMYKINLWSRFALRVLVPVVEFQAKDDKELYSHVHKFSWHHVISPDKSIMIDHISFSSLFPNSQFLAQKAKDAIVDKIRDKKGSRPYVDFDNPDILLNIHATDESITVSLDASGMSLNRRCYRNIQMPNATNEVLAAALVELSGWTPSEALIDPMCGSGTILIEAAMKARNIAPNLSRNVPFGFQNWLDYEPAIWERLVAEAKAAIKPVRLNLIGSDINSEALDIAKTSTLDLGLNSDIRIMRKSLREQERITQSGVVITCPPYNATETKRDLGDLYQEVAYYLSKQFPDHDAWIYSTNLQALKAIQFKAEKKFELYNGSSEGNFNMYPF